MVKTAEFIPLPYTQDLTHAGIAYACRSLAYTYDRMGGSPYDRLRRIVGGVVVELAFRRYLYDAGVPFDVRGATPFTDPDRYDVALGGRRCDLKSFLILDRDRIRRVRQRPELLLDALVLVPLDQVYGGRLRPGDLYLFSFQTALITQTSGETERALAAGQPHFILHSMPRAWSQPVNWQSLAPLAVKGDISREVQLSMVGQDRERDFLKTPLALSPLRRQQVPGEFYSLEYMRIESLPDGVIGVHSSIMGAPYLIETQAWANIWVYGLEILLVGYITSGEFRRQARLLPVSSRVFPYTRTRVENLALPVRALRPIQGLLERVREWGDGGPGKNWKRRA